MTWPHNHEGGAENTFQLSDIPLKTGSQLQNDTRPSTSVQVIFSPTDYWKSEAGIIQFDFRIFVISRISSNGFGTR